MGSPLRRSRADLRARRGVLLAALALAVACSGGGKKQEPPPDDSTIEVQPGESIQAALDRATAGTTVRLAPGVYPAGAVAEAMVVFRAAQNGVVLRGGGASPADVVLDGDGKVLHVVYVDAGLDATTRIENLTVTGGYADPYQLFPGGLPRDLRPELAPDDDFYHDGGGLMLFRASPTLSGLEVHGNYALRCGGGVSVFAAGGMGFPAEGPLVTHSYLHDNYAGSGTGGGVDVYFGANARMVNDLLVDNHGAGAQIAVLGNAVVEVRSCTFVGGERLGAVAAYNGGLAQVYDSVFAHMPTLPMWKEGTGAGVFSHCAYWDVDPSFVVEPGQGHVSGDPLFVTGPRGGYYLAQAAAGQAATSPYVDAGSGPATGLTGFTTRVDGGADTGMLDLGYHYPR